MLHRIKILFGTNLGGQRYDTDVEVVLYRVICELINNSLKHSQCSKIRLSLQYIDSEIRLNYSDNGVGFNPQEMVDCGMGLSNISSRVNSLNGTFEIESEQHKGMSATISINNITVISQ